MIAPAALFLTFISLLFLLISPQTGLLIAIASKPIIDASWEYHGLFGFSALDIIGVGLPAILMFRLLVSRPDRPHKMRFIGLWTFYIFANLLGFSIMLTSGEILWTASIFFRVLNGFVAFYVFQTYFCTQDNFRKLLVVYLIAGLFPMLMGLYEVATGEGWRLRYGVEGQIRITGIYHNSLAFRYYGYMTLTAIVLYWAYFLKRSNFQKIILIAYACICSVILFKVYSKAAFATLGLGLIIWTFQHKKQIWLVPIAVIILALNFTYEDMVFKEVATTFSKETGVLQGEQDVDRLFAGRVGGWRVTLNRWSEMGAFYQLFGTGMGGTGGGHNDYLRALMNSGIVGLIAYITLLMAIGFRLISNLWAQRNPLNTMAVIIYIAWMIDTVGATPGIYTNYQWYVWGYIGLALHGVKGLSTQADSKIPNRVTTNKPPKGQHAHSKSLKGQHARSAGP